MNTLRIIAFELFYLFRGVLTLLIGIIACILLASLSVIYWLIGQVTKVLSSIIIISIEQLDIVEKEREIQRKGYE